MEENSAEIIEEIIEAVDGEEPEEESNENPEDYDDIQEIAEKCIRCGLCKAVCPVYLVEKDERYSPRGKMILLGQGKIGNFVYDCALCKNCEKKCPLNLKITDALIKARKILIDNNKEPEAVKEAMKKYK